MKSTSGFVVALLLATSGLLTTGSAQGDGHDHDKSPRRTHAEDVNVVNSPNVNVVNTPNVNVTNTSTVVVGNTPSVNVANTPSVKVSNDSTQPVITGSIDDPGRIPYQTRPVVPQCSGNSCVFDFGAVPAGHRVVIQHVSGFVGLVLLPPNPILPAVGELVGSTRGSISFFLGPPASPTFPASAFDQTVQAYFDPGDHVVVSIQPVATNEGSRITLSGYQLDCTAAPCAPIAP